MDKKGIIIIVILTIIAILGLVIILPQGDQKTKKASIEKGQTSIQDEDENESKNINNKDTALQTKITKLNGSGEKVNTSEKINQNKETQEFILSNVSLKEVNGETVISARITNKSGVKQAGFMGSIVLLDRQENEIGKMPVKVSEMNVGETKQIEASITESYADAYDYKLEK